MTRMLAKLTAPWAAKGAPARRLRIVFGVAAALIVCVVPAFSAARGQGAVFDLPAALDAARPGDVILVPAGSYAGPLVIDKPVTLDGQGQAVIAGSGRGDVVTITAPDVTLRGFTIRHSGDQLDQENAGVTGLAPRLTIEDNRFEDTLFGVYLKEAPHSIVRGNEVLSKELALPRRGDGIRIWYSDDSLIENNYVHGSRDVVIWFSPNSVVRGNRVENGRYGLHFMFSDNQLMEDNFLSHNSVGAFLMYGRGLTMRRNVMLENRGPSGYGVGLKDVDDIVAEGNRFIANRVGVYVDNSPREAGATVRFAHNLLAYNDTGLLLLPLVKHNTYVDNVFLDNDEQIGIAGSGQLSDNDWSVDGRGNYWSDYAGFDAGGDAIGDLPYTPLSLYEDLMITHPELRVFRLSPVADALDLAAKAFPIFQPQPKITDEHPLTAPPPLPEIPWMPAARGPGMLGSALALVGLALLILLAGVGRFQRTIR